LPYGPTLSGDPRIPTTDEDAARQFLSVFGEYKVPVAGVLRRLHFQSIRDADFSRGLNRAVENQWVQRHERDRYRYILTQTGKTAIATVLNATT
jgi:hypothetical protein